MLPPHSERLRRRARQDLERVGVELRLGTRVVGVDEAGLAVASGDGDTGRIEATFRIGFKNRVATVTNWAVAFLGHGRRQRTITKQQVLARTRGLESRDAAGARPATELETAGAR